jgi:predicted nucleotidyltransferase
MISLHLQLASKVADRFRLLPEVEAIAIAGSRAGGHAGETSDIDLYVYTNAPIPAATRELIGREFSEAVQVVDYWGDSLVWTDADTGIELEVMFFSTEFMIDQVERRMIRHEPAPGWTTCFVYTVAISKILFERKYWLTELQKIALQPYPEPLAQAIVQYNFRMLRGIAPSFPNQIAQASKRGDLVSLNHRTAGLFACYFDIIFAVNRRLHPGNKRLLALTDKLCPKRPANMDRDVKAVLHASANGMQSINKQTTALIDSLEALLKAEGFL